MFDLENAIAAWRRDLASREIPADDTLDELEAHLRDDLDAQLAAGISPEAAFSDALRRLGDPASLKSEFHKNAWFGETRRRLKHLFLNALRLTPLLPTPLNLMSISMNSPAPTLAESRTATYLKAAAFLLPAIGAWTFSSVFLSPKLREISQITGVGMPSIVRAGNLLSEYNTWVFMGLLAIVALLEWRSSFWTQHRRTALSIGVFCLNSAVLLLITIMIIFAIIAAAPLLPHAR